MAKILLTKSGYEKLEQELTDIQKVQLPSIKKRMISAREDGDLSENHPWITAKEEMDAAKIRIAELKRMLKEAQLVEATKNDGIVDVGDTVTIEVGSKKMTVSIVSSLEADPVQGKVSNESPLGKIILGQKKGATVTYATPAGNQKVKILSIA